MVLARRPAQQAIHGREQEGGGLAGAGLRLAFDVTPVERNGQGAGLDGSAEFESRLFDPLEQRRLESERVEGHVGVDSFIHVIAFYHVSCFLQVLRPGAPPDPGGRPRACKASSFRLKLAAGSCAGSASCPAISCTLATKLSKKRC